MSKSADKTPEEIVSAIISWEWMEMAQEQGDRDKLPQMIRDYAESYAKTKCKEQREICARAFEKKSNKDEGFGHNEMILIINNAPEPL